MKIWNVPGGLGQGQLELPNSIKMNSNLNSDVQFCFPTNICINLNSTHSALPASCAAQPYSSAAALLPFSPCAFVWLFCL